MLNFTVGPVQTYPGVLEIGAQQVPYFRTQEFSEIMLENERLMKKFTFAGDDAKVVFITGSGTAGMEAAVINSFCEKDKVLVVNGGSFGQRFVDLCSMHGIPFTEIKLAFGEVVTEEQLNLYDGKGYTGFLVNLHETSTGVKYDIELISRFCKKNDLFLMVDSISSFLCDSFHMKDLGVDMMITGSQKALACPPGVSVLVLSDKAVKRVQTIPTKVMYLDLKNALKNAERGQTPFTPAVGTLLQINERLKEIDKIGIDAEIDRVRTLAQDFRNRIKDLPLRIVSSHMSNAVTPLSPCNGDADTIFNVLKDEYGIWICPNGGELKHKVFRVGHIGNLSVADNTTLINALKDLQRRGIL